MNEIVKNNEFEVYKEKINIDLFNKIIAFINSTNSAKRNIYSEISKKCIWNKSSYDLAIKEEYKFQYFGELLERYEERIGKDIKDIRAIAIALGYAKNFIDNNMIVGTQLIDFINKIKKIAPNDIYLKAALYLYDSENFSAYGEEFINKTYANTEEMIFIMSIMYGRLEDFLKKNRQQIVDLLGKNRTMNAFGNSRVYAWTIEALYPLINKDRKKDIALLKALIKLPTGFQKEDTNVYECFIENGYTREEIWYLNYLVPYFSPVPKCISIEYSIVEEKIATNLCKILINSSKTHTEDMYEFIKNVLKKYDKYQIKCYGFTGIKQVFEDNIDIINPITFSKLYFYLDENLYSFNILDEKWDIVVKNMSCNEYQDLFDNFLEKSNFNKKELKECINRYNMLTNKNYTDSFIDFYYKRMPIFSLLIDKGAILLKDVYEKTSGENGNKYLKEYMEGIKSKKTFEFLKYILRQHKYSIKEISNIGFKFERLIRGYSYGNIYLDIERDFLNIKGYRILLDCLEKYVFYNQPDEYFKFMKTVLNNDIVCKIYKKEKLRNIYFSLCEIDPETYKSKKYQRRYLNEDELNEIDNQKRLEEEQKNKKELQEAEEYINKQFTEIEDKNNFESLYKFYYRNDYPDKYLNVSTNLVKNYMLNNIGLFNREIKQISYFIKLIDHLIYKEKLTSIEFSKIVFKYMKGEIEENEYINTTCSANN